MTSPAIAGGGGEGRGKGWGVGRVAWGWVGLVQSMGLLIFSGLAFETHGLGGGVTPQETERDGWLA